MNRVPVLVIEAGEAASSVRGIVNTDGLNQFCFTRVPTLSEGLHALRKSRFQLVLVNLSLPDTSSAESVRKTVKAARDAPVIALMDEGDATKAAEALRHGADDYVVTGCRCDALAQTMRHVIERKQFMEERARALKFVVSPQTDVQLLAHLSHEVRNALACIHQFGVIMIDGLAGSVSEEQREYLCIIIENAAQIRKVLDSALEQNAVQ